MEGDVRGEDYGTLPALHFLTVDYCIMLQNEVGVAYPVSGDHTTKFYKEEAKA